ncbi:MAG TPA: hypothetical protein VEV83_04095, partial [Parafilimonas sp.]|nr:hypothetical protein [Parafilimonas sp.]
QSLNQGMWALELLKNDSQERSAFIEQFIWAAKLSGKCLPCAKGEAITGLDRRRHIRTIFQFLFL